jgi:hypothetical protein
MRESNRMKYLEAHRSLQSVPDASQVQPQRIRLQEEILSSISWCLVSSDKNLIEQIGIHWRPRNGTGPWESLFETQRWRYPTCEGDGVRVRSYHGPEEEQEHTETVKTPESGKRGGVSSGRERGVCGGWRCLRDVSG